MPDILPVWPLHVAITCICFLYYELYRCQSLDTNYSDNHSVSESFLLMQSLARKMHCLLNFRNCNYIVVLLILWEFFLAITNQDNIIRIALVPINVNNLSCIYLLCTICTFNIYLISQKCMMYLVRAKYIMLPLPLPSPGAEGIQHDCHACSWQLCIILL